MSAVTETLPLQPHYQNVENHISVETSSAATETSDSISNAQIAPQSLSEPSSPTLNNEINKTMGLPAANTACITDNIAQAKVQPPSVKSTLPSASTPAQELDDSNIIDFLFDEASTKTVETRPSTHRNLQAVKNLNTCFGLQHTSVKDLIVGISKIREDVNVHPQDDFEHKDGIQLEKYREAFNTFKADFDNNTNYRDRISSTTRRVIEELKTGAVHSNKDKTTIMNNFIGSWNACCQLSDETRFRIQLFEPVISVIPQLAKLEEDIKKMHAEVLAKKDERAMQNAMGAQSPAEISAYSEAVTNSTKSYELLNQKAKLLLAVTRNYFKTYAATINEWPSVETMAKEYASHANKQKQEGEEFTTKKEVEKLIAKTMETVKEEQRQLHLEIVAKWQSCSDNLIDASKQITQLVTNPGFIGWLNSWVSGKHVVPKFLINVTTSSRAETPSVDETDIAELKKWTYKAPTSTDT